MTGPHLFTDTEQPTTTAGRLRATATAHGWTVAEFAGNFRARRGPVAVLVTVTPAGRVAGYAHSINGNPEGSASAGTRDKAGRVLAILTADPAAVTVDTTPPALPAWLAPGARVVWTVPHVGPAVVDVLTASPHRVSYRNADGSRDAWTAGPGRTLADVLPATLRPITPAEDVDTPPTAEELAELEADGRAGYAAGRLAAPWLSPVVRRLTPAALPVGSRRFPALCAAYSAGYEAARAVELAALLEPAGDVEDLDDEPGALSEPCDGCGAAPGETCREHCTGYAAHLDAATV